MTSVLLGFNWQEDLTRAVRVRDACALLGNDPPAGCFDVTAWEAARSHGDGPYPGLGLVAIKRMLDDEIEGTLVTAFLIGANTAGRRYIDHLIQRTIERDGGLLAIYIDGLPDENGHRSARGRNPLDDWLVGTSAKKYSDVCPSYDWIEDDGPANCVAWFERAASQAPPETT